MNSHVFLIALSFHKISQLIEIWIEFRTEIHLKFMPNHQLTASTWINEIFRNSIFHTFTGCNPISVTLCKGKKSIP